MPTNTLRLTRRDILDLEQRLCDCLGKVVRFASHAVYFPQEDLPPDPVWIPEEGTLLIPLAQLGQSGQSGSSGVDRGSGPDAAPELLGVFAAREVTDISEDLLAWLPGIVGLCLDNLALYKAGRMDAVSGLANRQIFVERVSREIAAIQGAFAGGDDSPAGGSFGILGIRLAPLRQIAREHGQGFAERLLRELAAAFVSALPESALAARNGDTSLIAFLPAGTRTNCEQVAAAVITALDAVRLPSPLSLRPTGVMARVGFALYPQDMDGIIIGRDPLEQAQRLAQRAALAASVAAGLDVRCMGYGRILSEGGGVVRPLPLSRLVVNLGRTVGAREGQRFAVWARDGQSAAGNAPVYKGELTLIKVHQDEAEAEVLHFGEPGSPPAPGDMLTLLPESGDAVPSASAGQSCDPGTHLLRHGDFLARLATEQNTGSRFALALVHVDTGASDPEADLRAAAEAVCAHCNAGMEPVRVDASPENAPADVFGGRYGHHTLIFFHGGADPDNVLAGYRQLAAGLASRLGCKVGVGLAVWPFLRFRPADMLECARKALNYALLLPEPHVGLFDSLAMNISADKKHCLGDVFGAIEEYKLALLADAGNALAWNSLGVCMAGLGRHAEARQYFEEALARTPDDAALAYNLGAVCLNLGDLEAAERHFHACLQTMPDHLYAFVRLGQTAEQRADFDAARDHYLAAARLEGGSGLPFRYLARLSLREGQTMAAREHLHQALQRDPGDAVALQLMAAQYLEGGEDPELAESLARQSVALSPERKSGWLVLAQALERQQRADEARQARLRAGEL